MEEARVHPASIPGVPEDGATVAISYSVCSIYFKAESAFNSSESIKQHAWDAWQQTLAPPLIPSRHTYGTLNELVIVEYKYVYIYIYIYIHTYTHTHIYIYLYIHMILLPAPTHGHSPPLPPWLSRCGCCLPPPPPVDVGVVLVIPSPVCGTSEQI